ncbi:hypothetical protein G5I_08360 [Acromyrmex echinatior]|uniref:DUF4817 domain-containing protein n=1 Tax=Acromyrmex echinatior TaxID=103372 RepID=F4WRB4_ACREC|nr:hypothetical protein G5I_08360 [Acromyrmex echinatior]
MSSDFLCKLEGGIGRINATGDARAGYGWADRGQNRDHSDAIQASRAHVENEYRVSGRNRAEEDLSKKTSSLTNVSSSSVSGPRDTGVYTMESLDLIFSHFNWTNLLFYSTFGNELKCKRNKSFNHGKECSPMATGSSRGLTAYIRGSCLDSGYVAKRHPFYIRRVDMQTVDVSFIPDGGYDYAFVFAGGPRYIWNKEDEKDGEIHKRLNWKIGDKIINRTEKAVLMQNICAYPNITDFQRMSIYLLNILKISSGYPQTDKKHFKSLRPDRYVKYPRVTCANTLISFDFRMNRRAPTDCISAPMHCAMSTLDYDFFSSGEKKLANTKEYSESLHLLSEFFIQCCVAETVRILKRNMGRDRAPTEGAIRKLVRKVREKGMLVDDRSGPRARTVRTPENIEAVAQSLFASHIPTLSIAHHVEVPMLELVGAYNANIFHLIRF